MIIAGLILTPLLFAVMALPCRRQRQFAVVTRLGAAVIIAASLAFCVLGFDGGVTLSLYGHEWVSLLMLAVDALIAAFICFRAVKKRRPVAFVLALAQFGVTVFYEMRYSFVQMEDKVAERFTPTFYTDKLAVLMVALVGVIGSLICVYAIEYMKDYHRHHPQLEDNRNRFFAVLFMFMSAMFGLVLANDLPTMLFFWEITSLCSFLLIGYTKTDEAVNNSFIAIELNVFGGLCFSVGLALLAQFAGVRDLLSLNAIDDSTVEVSLAVFLIACAGLTKSAQFPFSKWLLGAMVAPTPTSAMLHSSTMVKAGVFLIIRLAPHLGTSVAGVAITLVGGITFLVAAILAVGRIDAKRVLAYSTISNLGLIVACAAINTPESIWAAVMLIVFHAIAKSLLFLAVGSTEHQLGSRAIEDMDGLYKISRTLTFMLIIGIAGMFLAPFGMLIAKWAAMKAFIDSNNIIIVLFICYGSSVTLFFWTKWLGKLLENANRHSPTSYRMRNDERVSMFSLAALVVVVCVAHPLLSTFVVAPYINAAMPREFISPISGVSTAVIMSMIGVLFVSVGLFFATRKRYGNIKKGEVYLSGQNAGDGEHFYGAMGSVREVHYRNWYLRKTIKEPPMFRMACMITGTVIVCGVLITMGGVLL